MAEDAAQGRVNLIYNNLCHVEPTAWSEQEEIRWASETNLFLTSNTDGFSSSEPAQCLTHNKLELFTFF